MRYELNLPMPPSSNHVYFNNARGGRSLTTKAREYREHVARIILAKYPRLRTRKIPPDVRIILVLHVSSSRWITKKGVVSNMDIDNRGKLVQDAICDVLCEKGDRQVWTKVMRKKIDTKEGVLAIIENDLDR